MLNTEFRRNGLLAFSRRQDEPLECCRSMGGFPVGRHFDCLPAVRLLQALPDAHVHSVHFRPSVDFAAVVRGAGPSAR